MNLTYNEDGYVTNEYNEVTDSNTGYAYDDEENILFQKNGRCFWLRGVYILPNIDSLSVNKLLIEKIDEEGDSEKEQEY